MAKKKKKWIQKAIKKPGALRKQLGAKKGKPIPAKKLAAAAKKRRQAAQSKTVTARRVAVARSGQSAAGPRGGGRSSTPAQAQPKAGRAQRAQTAEAAAPVRLKPRRTVWRREILGVAQNSS